MNWALKPLIHILVNNIQLMLLLLYCAIKLHQLIGHCLSCLSHHLLQFTSVTLILHLEEPGRYTTLTPTSGPCEGVFSNN